MCHPLYNLLNATGRYLVCLVAGLWLTSCQSTSNKTQNPTSSPDDLQQPVVISVVVSRVSQLSATDQLMLSGSTEAETTVNLGFMVSGKLDRVTIQEGQTIRAGQLIASIEPTDYQLGVTIANANVARVQDEYNRLSLLNERGSVTPSDYQKVVTGLDEVKARQQLAAKNLKETKLVSPISGIVARKGANVGEIIPQGQPLFQIADIQPIKVRVSVPESEVGQLRLGHRAQVTVPAIGQTVSGTVSLIGAVADPASRSYSVKIDLANPALKIRPGMIADVQLPSTRRSSSLVIVGNAIQRDADGLTYVFVVDEAKKQAFKRKITIGQVYANEVQITSGLTANELIVTGGMQKVQDGTLIQFNQPAQ